MSKEDHIESLVFAPFQEYPFLCSHSNLLCQDNFTDDCDCDADADVGDNHNHDDDQVFWHQLFVSPILW